MSRMRRRSRMRRSSPIGGYGYSRTKPSRVLTKKMLKRIMKAGTTKQ